MSNQFSRQILEREQADSAMEKKAEQLISTAAKDSLLGRMIKKYQSNDEALESILSKCGIDSDQLKHLEHEDVLFMHLEDEPEWYRHLTGYCVGVDSEGNYTAILPFASLGYYYLDKNRKRLFLNRKRASQFTKVYCLCRLLPDYTMGIRDLLKHLLTYMHPMAFIIYILSALIAVILGLIFPQMVNILLNNVDGQNISGFSYLLSIAGVCLLAEIPRLLLTTMMRLYKSAFTNMVSTDIKNAVLIRYLSDTSHKNTSRSASEVWTSINKIVPEFIENLVASILTMIPSLLFTLAYCLAAIFFLGELSRRMLWIIVILAICTILANKSYEHWYKKTMKVSFANNHLLFQVFKGIEKIRSREAQKRIYLKWARIFADKTYKEKKTYQYIATCASLNSIVTPLLNAVIVTSVLTTPIVRSDLVVGTLLAGLLAAQITDLAWLLEKIFDSSSVWETISFLFEKPQLEKKVKCTDFTASLQVQRLSFGYPGMERLINNISFEVKEGEYLGIVGMSGCGKSTLLRLILGMLTPDKGEITFGQYDLSDTDQRSILRNIGIVMQNESLIPGTIRENLMMQPRPVTEEKIWETLEKVKIADTVRNYPNGLDTEIGMTGASMSGGQMQKLLIARAIISEPKMLIFDEATSALDNISQKEVKEALDTMNCTRIVVAHRLSTVKDCDRLILLEKGTITQEGTYEELLHQEGLFRDLVLCQGA